MKQINLNNVDWNKGVLYVIIVLLLIILFGRISSNSKLEHEIKGFKKDIKISDLKQQKYVNRINVLNDSLVVLERTKVREKIKIVTVIKEVEKKSKDVGSLTTNGIATFYEKRYQAQIFITKYGVSLSDPTAKKNIIDVIERDSFSEQLKITKNILAIEEKKGVVKDSIIIGKDSIIFEKTKVNNTHLEIEKSLNKTIKSERLKKNIWKVATFGVLGGAMYLLAR